MDFISIENFSNSTKIILTSIITYFFTEYQNNIELHEKIQSKSNTHLKTQLYIIFDNSNLFNKSEELININDKKRKTYIQLIRKFFVKKKKKKKKKGINLILRDTILKNKFSQFISSEDIVSQYYNLLYDDIRYNEKNLRFIKTEFSKKIQETFSKILIKLSNYNKIFESYNIKNIKNNLSIIKIFYNLDDKDKKMYINNQIDNIENEISKTLTYFLTEINNNIDNNFDNNFDIKFLKPNDISILSNETNNAEQIWRDLTKSNPSVKYDINPDIYFTQFVKLFDFLRKHTEIFQLNTKHINILIHNTEEYIKFFNEEKEILSNIQYYSYNKNQDEVKNLTNFLNYLKKMPESDKNLLNKIILNNSSPIKRLFDKINSNYNNGIIKCKKHCDQHHIINNANIDQIKYYDENTKKIQISYNILLIYLNKCRNILAYKKQRESSNNLLPIGINLNNNYKVGHETYAYICNNILEYYVKKNITNVEDNIENKYIVQIVYYKEFTNIKNILKDYSKYYQNFEKILSSKDFTEDIQNIIKSQLDYTNKHILDTKSEVQSIINNIENDKIFINPSALTSKLEKNELKLYYDDFLKNCKLNHYQKLHKNYINKNTNITTFIKTIDNKLVKKLLQNENKKNLQNIEWNIMMSKNRKIFIAYFSNLFENVLYYFGNEDKKNIYSFDIFNSNNINHTISLTDSEYITLYEQNFNKWISSIKYILPIKNYIERYIQIFDKYLTYNLFKVINNRIILLETSDEIKFYNNLQTSNDKDIFTRLVLEKQIIIETLLTFHSKSKLYVMQQNFYNTLFNISFTNENLTKPIENYINKIQKQINNTTDHVSSLKIISTYMQDDEKEKITRQIKYKTEYINNLQKLIKKIKILDTKYKTFDYDIEDYVINNDEQDEDEDKDKDEDEDEEGDGEYGETNEPDEYNDSIIMNNYTEMDDFEQQSRINFEDVINLQQHVKFNNIKRWINTIYMYLNMNENKYISTQVITISENNEYKKTMNKNIHNTFAKYLKHPFLSTVSYSKASQLKYDKELKNLYRQFVNQIEFDVLKILSILYIIVYDLEQISQKKNITNSKTLLKFININDIDNEEDVISNFVKIINGRWKGHVGTVTLKYDNKIYIERKKNIIDNLNTTYVLFKKMKENFKKEEIDLRKKSTTKKHILETKKIIYHNEIITQKNEEFLNNIDKNIDNIKKIILKNIDELKNKKIYITLDRYGIKDTKYLPHIKPINILQKNVKFLNINTKQVSNSLTNKFEEIKEHFTNKKTLFDLTKSLFYVLEIFHPFTENKVEFDESFEKNYLIYIYNFAFNIFQKNRVLHKRRLLNELNEEYNIDDLTKQLNNTSLLPRKKRKLQTKIQQAEIKQKIYEIEEKYSNIFETTIIKKVRKEDITSFVNLYINSKGNILSEYIINAKKSVEIIEKEKEKILIEDINNQFDKFNDIINNTYKDEECDLINLLNV